MIVLVLMFAFNSQACDLHTRQHPDKPPYAQTISRLYVSVLGSIDQVLIVMLQFDQVTILHRPFPSGASLFSHPLIKYWCFHSFIRSLFSTYTLFSAGATLSSDPLIKYWCFHSFIISLYSTYTLSSTCDLHSLD